MSYKELNELKELTPEIILNWNKDLKGRKFLVRIRNIVLCPKEEIDVPLSRCMSCIHFFGNASPREIYCLPDTFRELSIRTQRKKEKKNV